MAERSFPKSARLRSSAEYRKVYKEGRRYAGKLFAAFCRPTQGGASPRVGWTTPKALGKAVVRNRIKRRLREAIRQELLSIPQGWDIVFNPRRAVADADFGMMRSEMRRLFQDLGTKAGRKGSPRESL